MRTWTLPRVIRSLLATLSPFRPALTDVLISQAGRPGPRGENFWGPPGDLFLWNKEREILQFLAASQTLGTLRVWGAVGRAWHAGQQGGTVCLDTERGVLGDAGHVGRAVARP